MATSGSRDFTLDVGEIVEEAFERCGMEVRTGYDARTARRSLNLMFADWANRGVNLWTVKSGTINMVSGQSEYTLTADVVDILEVVVRRDGLIFKLIGSAVASIKIFRPRQQLVVPLSCISIVKRHRRLMSGLLLKTAQMW